MSFKMEDKKVMAFVNANHEKSYNEFIKTQKKSERKDIIHSIMLFLGILAIVLILVNINYRSEEKALKNCVKNGGVYQKCKMEIMKWEKEY